MMRDEVFANAPKLKWVQALGTGVDGVIDQPSLGKDVTVTNIRGIHGAPVSEAAIMSMLALSRDLPRSVRSQDQNSWTRWPPKLLDNKTVGIYGIGLIAEALAPRCKAFGMTVVGLLVDQARGARLRPHAAAQRADRDREGARLSRAARPLLRGDAAFDRRGRVRRDEAVGAISINLARGGVVDEDAMMAALKAGKIAGAALDVFQTEPLPADHPLWSMKNVIITPHLGGFCDVYADLALVTVEHNMECFLRGDIDGMRDLVRK